MEDRDPQTHAIIGAAMEVHNELGPGFLESVYHEALAMEFDRRGIPYRKEVEIRIRYKGNEMKSFFRADFLCYDEVIVEIKAISELTGADEAQLINYLKATRIERGMLLNFGGERLQFWRRVF